MVAVYSNQIASLARQARAQQELTKAYLSRIGALLREAREQRNLSQVDVARSLGTDASEVARIERGAQDVPSDLIARLGPALDAEQDQTNV